MNVVQFFIICKRTNNANNATHYVKLGKKRRVSSKRNYYIISPREIIKAIIIMYTHVLDAGEWLIHRLHIVRANRYKGIHSNVGMSAYRGGVVKKESKSLAV